MYLNTKVEYLKFSSFLLVEFFFQVILITMHLNLYLLPY